MAAAFPPSSSQSCEAAAALLHHVWIEKRGFVTFLRGLLKMNAQLVHTTKKGWRS